MKVITSNEMYGLENNAKYMTRAPSILLMENAALRVTERCMRTLESMASDINVKPKVLIIAGPGNNGGDGLAAARLLHSKGVDVHVIFIGDINAVKEDAAVYLEIIREMLCIIFITVSPDEPVPDLNFTRIIEIIKSCDLVIDALFGIGMRRDVVGNYKRMIEAINEHAKHVISVDIPSGVHADTGQIMGCAVEADETVTFCFPKIGILTYPGAGCAGKVYVENISIPPKIVEDVSKGFKANTLTDREAGSLLPVRKRRSNKGDFGKVLVFAGSNEMPGAAALATSACYMAGGGLVCACVLPKVAQVIHHWQREATTRIVPEEGGLYCKKSLEPVMNELSKASVIILGPGIGRGPEVTEFVLELISAAMVPLVLDADALFALSEDLNILKTLKAPCIITPHPGEMSRLTGLPVAEILNNTIETAVKFSKDFKLVTLLKDASTIIAAPDGSYYINTTGNSALSKAGSGDVLCGIIAGFIAQKTSVFTAGVLGAYIHGKAGEAAALQKSLYGVTATDLIKYVPSVINGLITTNYGRIYHE